MTMTMAREPQHMLDLAMNSSHEDNLPRYHTPGRSAESSHGGSTPRSRRSMSLSYTEAAPNNHTRSNTMRSNFTQSTGNTQQSKFSHGSGESKESRGTKQSRTTQGTKQSRTTQGSKASKGSAATVRPSTSAPPPIRPSTSSPPPTRPPIRVDSSRRPQLYPSRSSSTLVGSGYERKVNDVDPYKGPPDTTERLAQLRELMQKDDYNLDY